MSVFQAGARIFRPRISLAQNMLHGSRHLMRTFLSTAWFGEAIVARIDVGFGNEEHGLVHLLFGHT